MTDIKTENAWLMFGDCLERMKGISDGSVDMILCDLPYGTTACKWDSIIPLDKLWSEYLRVAKLNAAIVLTAQAPFDKVLWSSMPSLFRYEWIWEKTHATGYLNAKKMPMKAHENIMVFYRRMPIYNPIMTYGHERKKQPNDVIQLQCMASRASHLSSMTLQRDTQEVYNYLQAINRKALFIQRKSRSR